MGHLFLHLRPDLPQECVWSWWMSLWSWRFETIPPPASTLSSFTTFSLCACVCRACEWPSHRADRVLSRSCWLPLPQTANSHFVPPLRHHSRLDCLPAYRQASVSYAGRRSPWGGTSLWWTERLPHHRTKDAAPAILASDNSGTAALTRPSLFARMICQAPPATTQS